MQVTILSVVTTYEATEATASVNFLASVKSITCLGEKVGIFVTTIIQQCCLGLTQGIYISEIRSLGLTLTESFIRHIQCFCSTAVIHPQKIRWSINRRKHLNRSFPRHSLIKLKGTGHSKVRHT